MSLDAARLERLLDRYLDEGLTEEEKTELEGMLRALPQARRSFWEHARFHALLREAGAEGRGRELADWQPRHRWWDAPCAESIGAAAGAMPVGWWPRLRSSWPSWEFGWRGCRSTRRLPAVAVLTQAVDVEWAPGTEPHTVGGRCRPGLRLKAGLAQIEFNDGARVIRRGSGGTGDPFALGRRSAASGRLSAQVPPAARGFKIASTRMTVVDLGTAFGFEVHDGAAAVHVFEGRVQLLDAGSAPTHELLAGQALAVDAEGVWHESTAVAADFPNAQALEQKAASSWQRRAGTEWKRKRPSAAAKRPHAHPALYLRKQFAL